MRRGGYEMEVSKPEVIFHEGVHGREEPYEHLVLDVPEDVVGPVMEQLGPRRADMLSMGPAGPGHVRLEFHVPARGLLGFRSRFLTDTRGYGTMNHVFLGYRPYAGLIPEDTRGALVAMEDGVATAYALDNAQLRGVLFIGPGTLVYSGMVVGENSRPQDLELNVCKKKHVTNVRNANSEEAIRLAPIREFSLDAGLEYLRGDELLEMTPNSLRIRKATLDSLRRKREKKQTRA
jgi:GTP-binding protein